MKIATLVLVLLSSSFVACGGGDAKAGEQGGGQVAQLAEGGAALVKMKMVKDTFTGLVKSLDGLKDPAAAEQAKAGLQQQVTKLQQLVGELDASKLGDLWGKTKVEVQKVADEQLPKLLEKYKANPELQKAVAPYLEQLKGLFAGK